MIRLFFTCFAYFLVNVPGSVSAEESQFAPIPEPPQLNQKSRQAMSRAPKSDSVSPSELNSDTPPVAAPEPPDVPMPIKSGEALEPDITIIKKGEKTFQEFRRNGILYMVKVIPDKGPAYYLIDINGDGKLDIRGSDLDKGLSINQWKLLEWN